MSRHDVAAVKAIEETQPWAPNPYEVFSIDSAETATGGASSRSAAVSCAAVVSPYATASPPPMPLAQPSSGTTPAAPTADASPYAIFAGGDAHQQKPQPHGGSGRKTASAPAGAAMRKHAIASASPAGSVASNGLKRSSGSRPLDPALASLVQEDPPDVEVRVLRACLSRAGSARIQLSGMHVPRSSQCSAQPDAKHWCYLVTTTDRMQNRSAAVLGAPGQQELCAAGQGCHSASCVTCFVNLVSAVLDMRQLSCTG